MGTTSSARPYSGSVVLRRVARGASRLGRATGLGLRPRPSWLRIAAGFTGLLYATVAFFVLALFDVPSGFHGWLPASLGHLPGLLLLTLGVCIACPGVAVCWAVAGALALGSWQYQVAAPVHERIEAVAAEVGAPQGWTRTDKEWSGNTWGLWSSWPEVGYIYTTSVGSDVAARELRDRLVSGGWRRDAAYDQGVKSFPDTVRERWERGRWNVTVSVDGTHATEVRRYDSTAPAGLTRVRLTFDGQR